VIETDLSSEDPDLLRPPTGWPWEKIEVQTPKIQTPKKQSSKNGKK